MTALLRFRIRLLITHCAIDFVHQLTNSSCVPMVWQGYGYYNQDATSAERNESGLLLFVPETTTQECIRSTHRWILAACMSCITPCSAPNLVTTTLPMSRGGFRSNKARELGATFGVNRHSDSNPWHQPPISELWAGPLRLLRCGRLTA